MLAMGMFLTSACVVEGNIGVVGSSTSSSSSSGVPAVACNVLAQDCPTGFNATCNPVAGSPTDGLCEAAGTAPVGAACSTVAGGDHCASGLLCVGEDAAATTGQCRTLCNGAQCGAGQWCMQTLTTGGLSDWGVCVAGDGGCDGLWQDCAGAQACMVPDTSAPMACGLPGTVTLDRTCFDKAACVRGLQCVALVGFNVDIPNYTLNMGYLQRGGQCRQLCHVGNNQRCRDRELCAEILNPDGNYRAQVGVCADPNNP